MIFFNRICLGKNARHWEKNLDDCTQHKNAGMDDICSYGPEVCPFSWRTSEVEIKCYRNTESDVACLRNNAADRLVIGIGIADGSQGIAANLSDDGHVFVGD